MKFLRRRKLTSEERREEFAELDRMLDAVKERMNTAGHPPIEVIAAEVLKEFFEGMSDQVVGDLAAMGKRARLSLGKDAESISDISSDVLVGWFAAVEKFDAAGEFDATE